MLQDSNVPTCTVTLCLARLPWNMNTWTSHCMVSLGVNLQQSAPVVDLSVRMHKMRVSYLESPHFYPRLEMCIQTVTMEWVCTL